MSIKLKPDAVLPRSQPPRRQSSVVMKFSDEMIDKLLQQGFIVPSMSSVAQPIVVAKAKGRDFSFCVDYRVINSLTNLRINFSL